MNKVLTALAITILSALSLFHTYQIYRLEKAVKAQADAQLVLDGLHIIAMRAPTEAEKEAVFHAKYDSAQAALDEQRPKEEKPEQRDTIIKNPNGSYTASIQYRNGACYLGDYMTREDAKQGLEDLKVIRGEK